MKKVTKYVAFDGKEFDLPSECEEYEKEGFVKSIESKRVRMQQLKSGELAFEFKRYLKAKARYVESCTTKMDPVDRANVLGNYASLKQRYDASVAYYSDLKRTVRRMIAKLEEINAATEKDTSTTN